ncbi:MAG: T9SS type A sorting domain-containing protein [Bacteroidota bacterium]
MKNFFLFAFCIACFAQLHAQNCSVPNGDFESWETVRLDRPFSTDSIDFFWPTGWSPFIWNGIDDYLEPATPGAAGGDSAVTMFSTEFDASVSRYFFCEASPTAFTFDYAHDGVADDSMQVLVLGVNVDTVGADDLDSLAADVLLDEVPYVEVYSSTVTIGGGAQSFTPFSMPTNPIDSVTTANLFIVAFVYNRSPNLPVGQRTTYTVDNANFSFTATNVDPLQIAQHEISLFPNPVTDFLRVVHNYTQPHAVKVIDAQGKIVSSSVLDAVHHTVSVDGLTPGFYMLTVENAEGQRVAVRKFAKK